MSEEQQNVEQIKALYDEASVDISLPDIPMPEPEPEKETEVKDELDGAFNFAFIGAGQGGSRIAETFHKLGYRKTAAINTAMQDLNTIKDIENSIIDWTHGPQIIFVDQSGSLAHKNFQNCS